MTEEKEKLWQTAIKDAQSLDKCAKDTDQYVEYMTDALALSLTQMYTNEVNGEGKPEDYVDTWVLLKKVGAYTIKRNHENLRISFTSEYAELEDTLRMIFPKEATYDK